MAHSEKFLENNCHCEIATPGEKVKHMDLSYTELGRGGRKVPVPKPSDPPETPSECATALAGFLRKCPCKVNYVNLENTFLRAADLQVLQPALEEMEYLATLDIAKNVEMGCYIWKSARDLIYSYGPCLGKKLF